MNRSYSILLILLFTTFPFGQSAFSQFTDDFSDGDFTGNPVWSGSTSLFTITSEQLNSNSPGANTYYLSTPSTLATEAEWEFFINLKFSTSGANYVDVFFISDDADLTATLNGYFVRIGNTADEISLYKVVSGAETMIIDGTDGTVNSTSNNPFNIRVTRDASDLWILEIDDGALGSYTWDGSITDNDVNTSTHFGVLIEQSTASGPVDNHFFDNFSVSVVAPDVDPPTINSITTISTTEIDVYFSEFLDQTTAETTTNYSIDGGIGQASTATLDAGNNSLVHLTFSNSFGNNTDYLLTVQNVEDLNSNAITTEQENFTFLIPESAAVGDLIINEIMADPSPVVGLPDAEYIELYNNSSKYLDLNDYSLNSDDVIATQYIIGPGEYVIIADDSNEAALQAFGDVIAIAGWSTTELTNSGKPLTLFDEYSSLIIDELTYADSWYNSTSKREGGWTLELIDPDNLCSDEKNWNASIDPTGGTPGKINSIDGSKPDLTGPKLEELLIPTVDSLYLYFNEGLDTLSILTSTYTLNPGIGIASVSFDKTRKIVELQLQSPLIEDVVYTITVHDIKDCSGNIVESKNALTFSLPKLAGSGDIIINEVLFDPRAQGVDFVEIFNKSDKYINLQNWRLANLDDSLYIANQKIITDRFKLIAPEEHLALTTDRLILANEYPFSNSSQSFEMSSLPTYSNSEGTVILLDPGTTTHDLFNYDDDMHHPLLHDVDGVSLERISADAPTNDLNNWHSAASNILATPGGVNSQVKQEVILLGEITISPRSFVPDNSGINDFTTINYQFDQSGFVANVKILDATGREVFRIANNSLLASSGFFTWNGTLDDGRKARVGVYIVYFEVFDTDGTVRHFKERVVVASNW